MGKPEHLRRPTSFFTSKGDLTSVPRAVDQMRPIVQKAIKEGMWLWDTKFRRWLTPEEFYDLYERHETLNQDWLDSIEIRDPQEGLDAADQQVESIICRRKLFEKRILEYFKNKSKGVQKNT